MREEISKIRISPEISIKEALKKIDEAGLAILFVCDRNDCLIGSLTDGDIRRDILKTGDLRGKVTNCFNPDPLFVFEGEYTADTVKALMLDKTTEVIPVLNKQKKIVDVLFWRDIFKEKKESYKKINIPVVIMAGGRGERMGPFTKIFPKPLMPVGEKSILEVIMDKFRRYGVGTFYITLNYKGEMIKSYLESMDKDYNIKYIWEKELLGTAGSLILLPSDIGNEFMVSNCDIVVDVDYADLIDFHRARKNILTIVGSIQHHKIPYGIIHFEEDGKVKKIQEKPEFDLTVNTGVYVVSKKAVDFIPKGKSFDMTDLMQVLLKKNKNIGVYPVSEKSYLDIGQTEEYKRALERVQLLS